MARKQRRHNLRGEAARNITHIECSKCGRTLPAECFARYPSGTYRHVCNQCRWVFYVLPSRMRHKDDDK